MTITTQSETTKEEKEKLVALLKTPEAKDVLIDLMYHFIITWDNLLTKKRLFPSDVPRPSNLQDREEV